MVIGSAVERVPSKLDPKWVSSVLRQRLGLKKHLQQLHLPPTILSAEALFATVETHDVTDELLGAVSEVAL